MSEIPRTAMESETRIDRIQYQRKLFENRSPTTLIRFHRIQSPSKSKGLNEECRVWDNHRARLAPLMKGNRARLVLTHRDRPKSDRTTDRYRTRLAPAERDCAPRKCRYLSKHQKMRMRKRYPVIRYGKTIQRHSSLIVLDDAIVEEYNNKLHLIAMLADIRKVCAQRRTTGMRPGRYRFNLFIDVLSDTKSLDKKDLVELRFSASTRQHRYQILKQIAEKTLRIVQRASEKQKQSQLQNLNKAKEQYLALERINRDRIYRKVQGEIRNFKRETLAAVQSEGDIFDFTSFPSYC